jgi:hypothetical protein
MNTLQLIVHALEPEAESLRLAAGPDAEVIDLRSADADPGAVVERVFAADRVHVW